MNDQYRVTLFKKKIKASIPGGQHIRFRNSHDKSHLVIPLYMSCYGREIEMAELITSCLKRKRIDYLVNKCPFRFKFGNSDKPWSIAIPVDQEALPERVRK